MLKKRIKIDTKQNQEPEPNSSSKSLQIRRLQSRDDSTPEQESKERDRGVKRVTIDSTQKSSSGSLESWIEENLLKDLVERVKKYEYLRVYAQDEWGRELDNQTFIRNLLKAFFARGDLEIFRDNLAQIVAKIDIALELETLSQNLRDDLKKLKEINLELLTTTVPKLLVIQEALGDFRGDIRELLEEEANERDTGEFLVAFSISFREILVVIELTKELSESERFEKVYQATERLFKSISKKYAVNRKRLLSQVAEYLSEIFESYRFISAEDYSFVDGKIHNIVEKRGQKIKEGLSFGVLKKETLQVVKYADVVTF
jgi:negative regulator of genetic competence, sporulation and motility